MRLRPLDAAALRSFELRPCAPVPAAAPSAPVDIRKRVWELAHIVHDAYTNHWPHTWARPTFANDPANPTQAEWEPCARQLLKSPGCKPTLEKWRDAPETAPKAREALTELIDKLFKVAARLRKQQAAEREANEKQAAARRAAQHVELAEQERTLALQQAQQQHSMRVHQLQEQLAALQQARKKDQAAISEVNFALMQANQQLATEQAEAQRRYVEAMNATPQTSAEPPPAEAAAAAATSGGRAQPPSTVKRPRV